MHGFFVFNFCAPRSAAHPHRSSILEVLTSVFTSLADSLPRVIHHLGPRYVAKFQATDLVRFLTYEASTALHIFLAGGVSPQSGSEIAHIRNTIKSGLGVNEAAVLFALNPASELQNSESNELEGATCAGDVFAVQSSRLDSAMWKIGGAAVALRLVQLANVGAYGKASSSSDNLCSIESA